MRMETLQRLSRLTGALTTALITACVIMVYVSVTMDTLVRAVKSTPYNHLFLTM